MANALIGHTGFVGGSIARQMAFDEFYNSANIDEIEGRRFDLVVCAGAPGRKWYANEHPVEDQTSIVRLLRGLRSMRAERLVLISTVDAVAGKDAYGRHRADLEAIVQQRAGSYVVRLPAIFGRGLKKNALFDLMNGHEVDKLAPNAVYQWYPLRRLGSDLRRILELPAQVVNLLSDPVVLEEIRCRFFPHIEIGPPRSDAAFYHVRPTAPGFWLSKAEVLTEMATFLGA